MQVFVAVTVMFLHMTAGADTPRTSTCPVRNISNVLFAFCYNSGLEEFPADLPRTINVLALQHNNLPSLDHQLSSTNCPSSGQATCTKFPLLVQLDVSYCGTENISSDFLYGIRNLNTLFLQNNNIQYLHEQTFRDNKFLRILNISQNNISSIPRKLFDGLIQLQLLDASYNRLHSLHQEIFRGLHSLSVLHLNNNLVSSLHHTVFADLSNMRMLYLDGNELTHFPRDLLQNLTSLLGFSASNNRVTSLSPTLFSNLPELRGIYLRNNLISRLSKYTMQDLISIYNADFSYNMIESLYLSRLPISIAYKYDLPVINTKTVVCTNAIGTEKPCFISQLPETHQHKIFHNIDFSYNNVSSFSFSKANMTHSLEFLNLSLAGNYRLNIPVDFIKRERFITELHLEWTNLSWRNMTLINEIFELRNMKILSIVGCKACERYTMSVLSSIFNPKNTVNVICGKENADVDNGNDELSDSLTVYTHAANTTYKHNSNDSTELEINSTDTKDLYRFPCERFENTTEAIVYFDSPSVNINLKCNITVDCSYSSVSVLPNVESAACVLFPHSGITTIPEDYFNNSAAMRYADLSYNCLSYLPSKIFLPIKNLFVLKLEYNMITFLHSSLFSSLTKLGFLSLKGNKILTYGPNTFTPLSSLQALLVDFSGAANVTDNTFKSQRNLKLLEVNTPNNNQHVSINERLGISYMRKLKSLTLRGFTLNASLSDLLINATGLNTAIFERSVMPEILDEYFLKLTELQVLIMRNNKIERIGLNAFKNLANLVTLDISRNEIHTLHKNLFLNSLQLEKLNISHNKIESFPATIFHNLSLLKLIDLSHNFIVKLDWNAFAYLYSLRGLNLRNNKITDSNESCLSNTYFHNNLTLFKSINSNDLVASAGEYLTTYKQSSQTNISCRNNTEEHLSSKPNLTIIDMSNNGIQIVYKEMFRSHLLQYLFLSENNIHVIDNDAFKYTPLLYSLILYRNFLTAINRSLFQNLTQLSKLDLSYNKIEFIEVGAFMELRSLKTLKLQFNRLKLFNANSYFSENVLVSLFLNDNSITLNDTNFLPLKSLKIISLNNNMLGSIHKGLFESTYSLGSLVLSNSNISTLDTDTFKNKTDLTVLLLNKNPLHSLTTHHFTSLTGLIYLDMSRRNDVIEGDINYAGLSWKNLTLLNYFFELVDLQYIVLAGNPICERSQWTQIIEDLFLSEIWRTVFCTHEFTPPQWYANSKTKYLSFNIDMVTRL